MTEMAQMTTDVRVTKQGDGPQHHEADDLPTEDDVEQILFVNKDIRLLTRKKTMKDDVMRIDEQLLM